MNVALRLFNKKCRGLVEAINRNASVDLACLVDADDHKWGCMENEFGLPYISPYKLLNLMENGEIDKLIIAPFCNYNVVNDVIKEAQEMGISKDQILVPSVCDVDLICEDHTIDFNLFSIDEYRTITRLQYHIADHCNMNCTSCSHFSSLVKDKMFMDIHELERDLKRLRQLVKHIDMIDVLGGEPFLNKSWKDYIELTKDIYRYSTITIITNGTLLWTLKEDDWQFIRDNNVVFRMSLYKPLWNRAEEIVNLLKEKEVIYNVNYRVMSKFAYMFLKNTKGTCADNRINCASDCFQLYHGKMTPCSRMMYVGFFNKYYGLDYPEDVAVPSIYNVRDYADLMKNVMKPMPLCKFCNIHLNNQVFQDWTTMGGGDRDDLDKWLV